MQRMYQREETVQRTRMVKKIKKRNKFIFGHAVVPGLAFLFIRTDRMPDNPA
jgi:hypothetical protein